MSWSSRRTPSVRNSPRVSARPAIRLCCALVLVPALSGCLKHWLTHEYDYDQTNYSNELAATEHYYGEYVATSTQPYNTGVALEIPDTPAPQLASDPESAEKWPLTLHECMEIALAHSKIVRQLNRTGAVRTFSEAGNAPTTIYDPAIEETRVEEALGRFDPTLLINWFWGHDREFVNNNIQGGVITQNGQIFKEDLFGGVAARSTGLPGAGDLLTLRKPIATGGEVSIGFNTDYTLPNLGNRFYRSAFDSSLFTTIRQPLLRGAGVDVNRAPIVIARIRADQALWEFRRAVQLLVRQVEEAYWELLGSEVQLATTKTALEGTAELVRIVSEGQIGPRQPVDLLEARQQFARLRRQYSLQLTSEQVPGSRFPGVLAAERRLRELMGLEPTDGKRIVPVDEPQIAPVKFDWHTMVEEAFTYQPEIQRAKLGVADARKRLLIARNSALPRFDLFARRDWKGLGNGFEDSVGAITDAQGATYEYGGQLEINLGYREATSALQRAREEELKAKELLRDQARDIVQQLTQNLREVDGHYQAYTRSMDLVQTTQERVVAERFKYENVGVTEGRFGIDRLLDAVQSLSEAQITLMQDKIEYNVALAQLEETKGTILRYNSIQLREGPWPDKAYPQGADHLADLERAIPCKLLHRPGECRSCGEAIPVYDHAGERAAEEAVEETSGPGGTPGNMPNGAPAEEELPPPALERGSGILAPPPPPPEAGRSEVPLSFRSTRTADAAAWNGAVQPAGHEAPAATRSPAPTASPVSASPPRKSRLGTGGWRNSKLDAE